MNNYFDSYLIMSESIGSDHNGRRIPRIANLWIQRANEIFDSLDSERIGTINAEKLLYFVLALISRRLSEVHESAEVQSIVKSEVESVLEVVDNYHGGITKIPFKIFLIRRGLWSMKSIEMILNELKDLLEVMKSKKFRDHFATQYSLLAESGLPFPPLTEQAFANTIPASTFLKQFMADSCNNFMPQIDYLSTHIPNFVSILNSQERQLLELYLFVKEKNVCRDLVGVEHLDETYGKELGEEFEKEKGLVKGQVQRIVAEFFKYYDLLIAEVIDFAIKFHKKDAKTIDEQKKSTPYQSSDKAIETERAAKYSLHKSGNKAAHEELKYESFKISNKDRMNKDLSQEEIAEDFNLLKKAKKRVVTLKLDLKNNEIHMQSANKHNIAVNNEQQNNSLFIHANDKSRNSFKAGTSIKSKPLMKSLLVTNRSMHTEAPNKDSVSKRTKRARNIQSPKQILDKLNKH
eukprot:TRINITY_DN13199_c0_g1_i1.p1 TRINITY_DN13199_c0_g1~~TRINITY_DN13199_c0_g1_i1.p1  ORF type:complete len:462 (-),score=63.24 TRINITY_DN13199_c0_g1_i1:38-1423(-)